MPRIAIIGAGPSGIAALKVLRQAGLHDTTCLEQGDRVGGNWVYTSGAGHSSVFESTHIISSKRLSEFSDFPMPADYPDYPSHRQLLAYFEAYARHFGLYPAIRFHTRVDRATPEPGGGWRLTLADGTVERFDHLLVASGHHWDPRMPEYPGTFSGELLHSHAFKTAEPFRAQRVLVIGGGNSACDIAVETSRVSVHTGLSTRRGYYIVPKFMFGIPSDVLNSRLLWLPRTLRSRLNRLGWRLETGGMARYGLPEPEHGILDAHPTVNSELLYFLRHGKIHPYPDVARFDGRMVHFTDGRAEPFDTVIAATGFRISFPFLDRTLADYESGPVELYLRVFHPSQPGLYFIGLVQPQGCIWPLAEAQAEVVAGVITGRIALPRDLPARARADAEQIRRRYTRSARHAVEVEYHEYLRALRRAAG
jgi:cation diffusion facilitator CzcD-associated flavoprotein CzcO